MSLHAAIQTAAIKATNPFKDAREPTPEERIALALERIASALEARKP